MSETSGSDLFRKNTIVMRVSREMALDYGLVEPTPEEAARFAEQRIESDRIRREQWAIYDAAMPQLAAITDTVARAVLDLHKPDAEHGPRCQGCDYGGYESEAPEWPCRTVEEVAAIYGIALPNSWHLWRRPEETK